MKKRGFTIVELLVVVSIIGLLSSIVMAALSGAKERGRIAAGFSSASSVYQRFGADATVLYNLDENSGTTAKDQSVNNVTLNVNNGVWATGIKGSGITFSATDKYAITTNVTSIAPGVNWTMSAWVNPSDLTGTDIFLSYGLPYLSIASGKFMVSWCDPLKITPPSCQQTLFESSTRTIGKWYYVVATHSDTTQKTILYVDGDEVASLTATKFSMIGTPQLYVGNHSSMTYGCRCTVDEVAIYTETLAASEIKQRYAEGALKHGLASK